MTDLDFSVEQATPLISDSRPIIGYQSAQHMMNANCNAQYQVKSINFLNHYAYLLTTLLRTEQIIRSTQVGSRRHRYRYSESSDIPRPNNNIVLAVSALLCSICCLPALFCAIIAVIYSLQVSYNSTRSMQEWHKNQ